MKQRIVDRILNSSLNEEINYAVLDEKASDMEVYECNMMSVYTDELDLAYWLDEEFSRGIQMFDYQTLYIECEDGADDCNYGNGWWMWKSD